MGREKKREEKKKGGEGRQRLEALFTRYSHTGVYSLSFIGEKKRGREEERGGRGKEKRGGKPNGMGSTTRASIV